MEDEKTVIEHTEKGGIGWFFFTLIPCALAGAALMWLAFYTGVIDWSKTQRIEGRMDARVGVTGQLTAPVDLVIRKTGCLQVSRSFLDSGTLVNGGSQLTAYVTNSCHSELTYWEIHWISLAPDGTMISNKYTNEGGNLTDGQTIEMREEVPNDSRTVKVVVWAAKK